MTEEQKLPTEKQIAETYRRLADDFADMRSRATHQRNWQRLELKQSLRKKQRSSPWARWSARAGKARIAGYSLATATAIVLTIFLLLPDAHPLRYTVEGGTVSDGWITTQAQAAQLAFSDGSRVQVSENSALNVNALGEHSALARLSRGKVRVKVEHHDDTHWTFLAGAYEVRVEGTAFDLSYSAEQLSLSMLEGRVRVVGPDRQEWVLHAGEQLVIQQEVTSEEDRKKPAASSADSLRRDATPPVAAKQPEAEEPAKGTNQKRPTADWSKLLSKGEFSEIVQAAKHAGVAQTLRARSTADLIALGHAARYTGDVAMAEECWKTIRGRAPGSSGAQQGAFFLGRIKEQQGRASEAIGWFEHYLAEAPNGVYAGQALGRQLVLASGQGKSSSAIQLAKQYLSRFPDGAYASAARAIVERPEEPTSDAQRSSESSSSKANSHE